VDSELERFWREVIGGLNLFGLPEINHKNLMVGVCKAEVSRIRSMGTNHSISSSVGSRRMVEKITY
jgi:hypothetical protein